MKSILWGLSILTLLSCNSATDDAAIRNSIAAEAQLQQMSIGLYERGSGFSSNIRSEYNTTPRNAENSAKRGKLLSLINQMDDIDSLTAEIIYSIDQLKVSLLKAAGENYSLGKEALALPHSFDFSPLKSASNTSIPTELLLNSHSSNQTGKELFNSFKRYRNELIKIVGRTETQKLPVVDITNYKSIADLQEKVKTQIGSKVPNAMEDEQAITDLYVNLTLPNHLIQNNKKIPWAEATFQYSNLIGAITQLTILQNKILGARAYAMAHIGSKLMSCGYDFDRIVPFSQGPSIIKEGDTAEITVGVAAFDSYNQPEVTLQSIDGEILKPENGTGKVRIKPKKGLQKIKGTVSIKNKSGIKKTENWEWDIQVLPKK
ncbi:MAG: hypothetical protein ACO1N0_11485 [Fluviicola sp.]